MADLSRIVSVVQIEDVRLREASCRSAVRPSEVSPKLVAHPSWDVSITKTPDDDGALLISADFRLDVRTADKDEEMPQAEVRGLFELSYRLPAAERFSAHELEEFARLNAVFNAWPYWRELVQASLTRMSMPVLTVPVYRVSSGNPAADDDGNTRVPDVARRRRLSGLGMFRQDFWNHMARRYPDDGVKPGYAGSNVYRPIEEAGLRIAQYVAQDGVGVDLVTTDLNAPDRQLQIKRFLEPLRKALEGETMSQDGGTKLEADANDRANWDRMADWLHDHRIVYERVLRETAV